MFFFKIWGWAISRKYFWIMGVQNKKGKAAKSSLIIFMVIFALRSRNVLLI